MTLEDKPFIEKYRPDKLDLVIGQEEIIKRLKVYVSSKNMPNLLFSGSQGTGKTSSSIALAKELYGSNWQLNFTEINASDERGIDVVRDRIKKYAAVKPIGNDVEFKIIFLDEADALTNDAQAALRRTMEKFTSSCRFILSCNYSSKIIEPLQSRCSIYRFKRIKQSAIIEQCKYIANKENLKIESEALEAIAFMAEGDARKAIGILDDSRLIIENNIITVKDIHNVASYIEPKIIIDILKNALSNEFFAALTIMENLIIDEGISADDIIKQLMKRTMELNISNKRIIIELVDIIGETHWRISEGANEMIAFKQMIAKMVKLGSLI